MHNLLHTLLAPHRAWQARATRAAREARPPLVTRTPRRDSAFRLPARPALAAVLVTALWASAGCVTVHGERAVIPSATKTDAGGALRAFVEAYNKADKAYDPALDAKRVTGPLSDINQSGLRAKQVNNPQGNPNHTPLVLSNPAYTIPKMAGWPKFFVVAADPNGDQDGDPHGDVSWLMVFTRGGPHQLWQAAYLSVLAPDRIPEFTLDDDGLAIPVTRADTGLAIPPRRLSPAYVRYLDKGGDTFAPGAQTSAWRAEREKNASMPGVSRQYVDQPVHGGPYAPVGLRTKDGGALVFFTTRHFEKETAAKGVTLNVPPDVKALTTGDVQQSITLQRVSNQAVIDPATSAQDTQVRFLSRIQGLVGAKGE